MRTLFLDLRERIVSSLRQRGGLEKRLSSAISVPGHGEESSCNSVGALEFCEFSGMTLEYFRNHEDPAGYCCLEWSDLEVERRVGLCPQGDRSNNPQMEF